MPRQASANPAIRPAVVLGCLLLEFCPLLCLHVVDCTFYHSSHHRRTRREGTHRHTGCVTRERASPVIPLLTSILATRPTRSAYVRVY